MKLLKILYSGDEGGILQAEIQYLNEFRKQGVEIYSIIIGNRRNKQLYQELSDFSVIIPDDTNLMIQGSLIEKIKRLFQLKAWAKKSIKLLPGKITDQKYDGIAFGRMSFIYLSYLLSKRTDTQSYYFMHREIVDSKLAFLYKLLFKRLKLIPIANSIYTRQSFKGFCKYHFYPGYDEKRTAKYYNGNTFRDDHGINKNTLVFGIAGRICVSKAQDLVTKVLAHKKFENEDYSLLLAGVLQDKAILNKIKAHAGDNFNKKVIYLGNLNDMAKFYASIDVYINSRNKTEPFGISVIEARASRLPIIASNIGGTAETVQDGYNGWTFSGFDYKSYKEVINRVFRERDRIEEMGKNSLNEVDEFSAETNVKGFIKLLRNVR